MLRYAICELVELVDEIAYIDTAHRVRLREWHGLRERLPERQLDSWGTAVI